MPWLPNLHTAEEDLWFFSNKILPRNTVEVAVYSDTIMGFVAYADDWVNQLYVEPEHRRNMIGSILLSRTMRTTIYRQLWVFEQNSAAQNFYARHGFKVVEKTDGSHNEEGCPDLRMEWRLGER